MNKSKRYVKTNNILLEIALKMKEMQLNLELFSVNSNIKINKFLQKYYNR